MLGVSKWNRYGSYSEYDKIDVNLVHNFAQLFKCFVSPYAVIDGEAEITCELRDSPVYMVGDEVTLTSTVKNVSDRIIDELKYQWLREESDGTKHELIHVTGKSMMLSPLTMKDAGRYHCVVMCDKLGEWRIESNTKVVSVEGELST